MDLPTGTVTFLFTDVEGSTRLARQLGSARFGDVLDAHGRLLREAFGEAGGIVVDSQGDGFFVAFRSASEATGAAAQVQRAVAEHRWPANAPLRVRVGIHTGEAAMADGRYRGLAVHRASRICEAAHGGQVLLSDTTRDLVEGDLPAGVELRDLGLVRLRDIERPERLFQLVIEGLPETFSPPRAHAARQPLLDRGDLLERDAELGALDALIAAAPAGGRLLAVEGPAGIGKTRLLAEARAHAQEAGMQVLSARGSELEQEFSFGAVRQLFEPLLAAATPEERAALLTGAASLALPIFDPADLHGEPGADSSQAMLHGLFWLTANLAEHQALLLLVDDLHWCDPPSLRWLAYLLPRIEGLQLLVVVGLRPAEPGADAALLDRITADPLATVVRPASLSEEATGALMRQILAGDVDAAFRAAFHEASGGNPLFVRELARAVVAEALAPTAANARRLRDLGGQAVARAVSLRLGRLGPEAVRLARAVAVLGDGADPRHAAALSELDEADAADAAAALGRVEILRRDVPHTFVHPVVRAAVYSELAAVERARGHRRAAGLLAESRAEPERVAAQLLLTAPADDAWVVGVLRDAARCAVARGAPDSAAAYLRRALDEPAGDEQTVVLHELGLAESRSADPEAVEHLAAAHAATNDVVKRARIALELAHTQFSLGEPPERCVETLEEALGELPADDDPKLAIELETQLISIARHEPSLSWLATERLERLRVALPGLRYGQHVVLANLASEAARAGLSRNRRAGGTRPGGGNAAP
jgi:class 3 adenylate cyclase